jgi:hypothetical protein
MGGNMKTTVLGVRLNDIQRDKLKEIGKSNRMSEGEVARLLIDSVINGEINIKHGKIEQTSEVDLSGLERLAKSHKKSLQQIIDMISEME